MDRNYLYLVQQIEELKAAVDRLKTHDPPGIWTDWTPTVTQGVAVTVTIANARYTIVEGNTVHIKVRMTATSAGTAGQAIIIDGVPTAIQPVNAGSWTDLIGSGIIYRPGVAWYEGPLVAQAANGWQLRVHNSNAVMGIDPNFGLANGNQIAIVATYEI